MANKSISVSENLCGGLIVRCLDENLLKKINAYTDGALNLNNMCCYVRKDASVNIFRAATGANVNITPAAKEVTTKVFNRYKNTVNKIEKIKSQYDVDLVKKSMETGCDDGIHFDYEYKGKYTPLSHQKIMYNMMAYCDAAALLSDPGTCKTGPYLWAADKRIQKGQVKKVLIITMASLVENIRPEVEVQVPHLSCCELRGGLERCDKIINKKFKIAKKNQDYDIYVASYDSMRSLVDVIPDNYFQMVILDEAHKIGSPNSQQTNKIIEKFMNVKYKYIATGTLNSNNLMSFFMPYKFLGDYLIPISNYEAFRGYYMRAVDQDRHIWVERKGAREVVSKIISRVAVTFKKEDCIELPELINETVNVELKGDQKRVYDSIESDMFAYIDDMCEMCESKETCDRNKCNNEVAIEHVLTTFIKLRQITSGFYKNIVKTENPDGTEDIQENVIVFDKNVKENALMDYLDLFDENKKIIIWCSFIRSVESVSGRLRSKYGENSVITCSESDNAFRKSEQFRDTKARFFVGTKGGVGLNMQYSNYMVFYEKDYSLVKREQYIGRQHRKGQECIVTAIDLNCLNTIDQVITRALHRKEQLASELAVMSRVAKLKKINTKSAKSLESTEF